MKSADYCLCLFVEYKVAHEKIIFERDDAKAIFGLRKCALLQRGKAKD